MIRVAQAACSSSVAPLLLLALDGAPRSPASYAGVLDDEPAAVKVRQLGKDQLFSLFGEDFVAQAGIRRPGAGELEGQAGIADDATAASDDAPEIDRR